MALLSAYGGLPWKGDTDFKYHVIDPVVLPYLSRGIEELGDDDEEDAEAAKDEKAMDEEGDSEGEDGKDGKDEREEKDEKGGKDEEDAKPDDASTKDGKDAGKVVQEDDDDDDEDDDPGTLVDYFTDFFAVNSEESMKYNYR